MNLNDENLLEKRIAALFPITEDMGVTRFETASKTLERLSRECKTVKTRVFKVETLPEYDASYEELSLNAFKDGRLEESKTLMAEHLESWGAELRDMRARGVSFIRIRLYRQPLSDYLYWELEAYRLNAANGETILFVSLDDYPALEGLTDFLMFDDRCILFLYQDAAGVLQNGAVVEKSAVINEFTLLASQLEPLGEAFERFL